MCELQVGGGGGRGECVCVGWGVKALSQTLRVHLQHLPPGTATSAKQIGLVRFRNR